MALEMENNLKLHFKTKIVRCGAQPGWGGRRYKFNSIKFIFGMEHFNNNSLFQSDKVHFTSYGFTLCSFSIDDE